MSASDFPYRPAERKVHTEDGKRRIAWAQHMRKVARIATHTGLSVEEVGHKLQLGLGYCAVHGWNQWARCQECKKDYKRRTTETRASVLVNRLREQEQTGAELADERQLDLPFGQGRRAR